MYLFKKLQKLILVLTFFVPFWGVFHNYLRMVNSFGLLKWKKN